MVMKRLEKRGRGSRGDRPAVFTRNKTLELVNRRLRVRRDERSDESRWKDGVIFEQLTVDLVKRMIPRLADRRMLADGVIFEGVRELRGPCFRLLHCKREDGRRVKQQE